MHSAHLAQQKTTVHTTRGENPELQVVFYRLCSLLKLPVMVVFVFDGADRPSRKRDRHVGGNTPWIAKYLTDLITAFGFVAHEASVRPSSV
jgi:hypothetical protein